MRVNGTEGADASESESSSSGSQMYLCVADGVGSWRQFGVDPRQFSHNLVRNAKKTIEIDAVHRESLRGYPLGGIEQGLGGLVMDNEPIRPLDVMVDAWNMTVLDKVKGSSTFCIATLDYDSSQLAYSNLGDCGLAIIRHVDSEKAGYMRYVYKINLYGAYVLFHNL